MVGRSQPPPRGFTNGSIPKPGRSAGLPGGLDPGAAGRTNGLVNGKDALRAPDLNVGRARGMVNSHSRTNGLAPRSGYLNKLPLRRNAFGIVTHSDLRRSAVLLAASLAVMLLLGYFLGTPVPVPSAFGVDGDFSEWSGVPLYDDPADVAPGAIDLLSYGIHGTLDQVFVYGKTRAPLFLSAEATNVYLVIDSSTDLGYQAPGIEADFLAEMWGWDGVVADTMLREWTGGSDRDNATSFRPVGGFPAVVVGNEFELAIREDALSVDTVADVRMVLAARSDDIVDLGATVGVVPGSLLVDQKPLTSLVTAAGPLVELRLRALAIDVRVDGITVQQNGGGTVVLPTFPFTVAAGSERVETLAYDPGTVSSGSFVSVRIAGVTAGVPGGSRPIPVTISGDDARFYVRGRPGGILVDGLFDDWVNVTRDPSDSLPNSIDIRESAASFASGAFFYLQTEGRILSGAFLPEHRERPVQTVGNASGAPVPLRRIAGEDVLRIYVDSDDRDSIGVPFGEILVDRWIEVRGRLGRITSASLFAWNPSGGYWDQRADALSVAFVGPQLEAGAATSFFGTVANPRVMFLMSDWSERRDLNDVLGPAGTVAALSPPSPPAPLHGPLPDNIFAPPLVNEPVVDGRCPTLPGEYDGAALGGNPDLSFRIGRWDLTEYVYICITATADATDNDWADLADIMFDTDHKGGADPQVDDRLFRTFNSNGVNYIEMYQGNGAFWDFCFDCDPFNDAAGDFRFGHPNYEFKIRYTDVWGTLNPRPNQVAGFAIVIWDASPPAIYSWGSAAVDENVPNTWGHIIIPEFPAMAVAAGTAIIPLAFLGRSRGRNRWVRR